MRANSSWLLSASSPLRFLQAGASCCVFLFSVPGLAQPLPESASDPQNAIQPVENSGNEDIIVTAERRSQRLQDVPISITALSSSALENAGVTNVLQLAQLTPGLVLPPSLSGGQALTPFIRGIGAVTSVAGFESSVAVYVDGVYSASSYSNQMDLANIERVEVLKGPQGTLYGRNATGGAINIITRAPSDTLEANASFSYGRFDETVEKGYVAGPLAANLNGSLSVVARQGGNYGDNGFTGRKFGGLNSIAVNGQLAWTPNDRLDVNISVFYDRVRSRRTDIDQVVPKGSVPLGGQLGGLFSDDPDLIFVDADPLRKTKAYSGALRVRYSLDNVDLLSISSYKSLKLNAILDADGTSLPLLRIRNSLPSKTFTQEVQAQSTGNSPFQWIMGAYYISFREHYAPFEINVAPLDVAYRTQPNTSGGSLFAQGTYEFSPQTKLTAGIRYSIEKKTISGTLVAPTLGNLVLAGPIEFSRTYKKPTWRISFQQSLSPDINAYVSYNRGFKSGGYNSLSIDPDLLAVKPEVLDAYELGVKSEFADRAVRLNAAFYYYDYKNIQVQHVLVGGGAAAAVLENAAAAKLYGIDADLALAPTRDLRLNAGINLAHSHYSSFPGASGFIVSNGVGIPAVFDQTDKRVLGAPNLTYNVGGSYKIGLGSAGSLLPSVNYSYSSKYLISPGDGNNVRGYGQLAASITWTDEKGKFSLEAWGRNLTDVRIYGQYTAALLNSVATLPPLSYGVTASVSF